MTVDAIYGKLCEMAGQPGIAACALVDAHTGLIWHAAGEAPPEADLWEAAADYWRMHERQKDRFRALGPLGAAVLYHRAGTLAVLPVCDDPPLLLVSFGRRRAVDWSQWQHGTRELAALVRRAHQPLSQ